MNRPSIPVAVPANCLHCGGKHDPSAARCPVTGRALGGDARLIGQLIDKRYRIVRLLGGGPLGSAYKAEHVALGRAVALRVLPATLITSPTALHRFFQEARLMSSVASPRIQPLIDAGLSQEGVGYVAYAYVRGRSLASALFRDAPFPLVQAATILCDVLEGLAAIHQSGFVHRALGPESVLLQQSDSGLERAMLTNFGAAALEVERFRNDPVGASRELAAAPTVTVARPFVPPERDREATPDLREDLFACGVLLAAMLSPSGLPHFGSDLLAIGVPAAVEAIVAKASHPLRGARFSSAVDMRAALMQFASLDPSETSTATETHISDLRALSAREKARQRSQGNVDPSDVDSSPMIEPSLGGAILRAVAKVAGAAWPAVARRVPMAGILVDEGPPPETPVPLSVLVALLDAADAVVGTNDRLICSIIGHKAGELELGDAIMGRGLSTPELFFDQEVKSILERLGSGVARTTHVGRGYGRVEVRGQKRPSLALCSCATGLLSELLNHVGARDVEFNKTACQAVGDEACIYTATWL